ncbi:MAG: hypothetical protein ABJO29_16420 [Yoonia sp.]|uniref:hypothetical protein n=1 Tax=Yoonia sp. TaxID=2212373 RepID=UPI00326347FD
MSVLRFLTGVCLTVLWFSQAMAQTVVMSGADDANFTASVDLWLAGEDPIALEKLAQLSSDGNRAAQVLLASIAARGSLHTHVTSDLTRQDRIALLRIAGGLSGKSWLTEAAKEDALAVALLQSSRIGEKAAGVGALFDLGEPQTAMLAAQAMLLNGEGQDLIDSLTEREARLPPEAGLLVRWALSSIASGAGGNTGSARIAQTLTGNGLFSIVDFAWVAISPRKIIEDAGFRDNVMDAVGDVPSWTPVTQFCNAHCPKTQRACAALGVSLTALAGPFPMRSPLMSVIPNEMYWDSPRAEGDLARITTDLGKLDQDWLGTVDACYVDAMVAAQADHGAAKGP